MVHWKRLAGLGLVLMLVFLLPVPALAGYLGGITADIDSPSFLPYGQRVYFSIDYKIDQAEGARIYVLPYTLGSSTPGSGVSGSGIVPQGTGTLSRFFTIYDNEQIVTHAKVYMVSPDQSVTHLEIFVPMHYVFGANGVFNIQTDHSQYSRLPYDRNLNIDFDYATAETGNVLIFARPFTDGTLTPGYHASGSAELPPTGSYSQHFFFDQDSDVTDIRFTIRHAGTNDLLDEFFVPFDVHWREVGLYNISFDQPDGENLHNSQYLNVTFTVEHQSTETRRAFAWCTTGGSYSPGGVYQGSVPVPSGPQTITRYCRIHEGETPVDGVRMTFSSSSQQLMHFILPADFLYAPHAVQNAQFTPASPAIMSNGEHLDLTFDYITDHDETVLIFGRAAYDGELLYGMTSSGSFHYVPPSGWGSYWMTYGTAETLASSVFLWMTNLEQTENLVERYVDGWWAWGTSSTITSAPDPIPQARNLLGRVYPNPFNPRTTVPVLLAKDTQMHLAVYDLRGRLVQRLHDGHLAAGPHNFTFAGEQQASGIYFVRMKTPQGVQSRPVTLLK